MPRAEHASASARSRAGGRTVPVGFAGEATMSPSSAPPAASAAARCAGVGCQSSCALAQPLYILSRSAAQRTGESAPGMQRPEPRPTADVGCSAQEHVWQNDLGSSPARGGGGRARAPRGRRRARRPPRRGPAGCCDTAGTYAPAYAQGPCFATEPCSSSENLSSQRLLLAPPLLPRRTPSAWSRTPPTRRQGGGCGTQGWRGQRAAPRRRPRGRPPRTSRCYPS
jgi:hypothetical protein